MDPPAPDRPSQARGGDAEMFRLQKRIEELESEVEAKESQAREQSRRLKSLEESERSLKAQLESFTKQAKETYRKYENFLEDAEEVAQYASRYSVGVADMLENVLESLTALRKLDIKETFNAALPPADREKVQFHLQKLLGSQYLKKKNIFKDGTRFDFSKVLSTADLQVRFDKVLEELSAPKREKSEQNSQITTSVSHLPDGSGEKPAKNVSFQNLTEDNREEFFDYNFKAYSRASAALADTFRLKAPLASFPKDAMVSFVSKTKAMLESFSGYLRKLMDETRSDGSGDLTNFNGEVDELFKSLKAIEAVDFEKLQELREKNRKLQILRSHIQNLTHENEELFRATNMKEFSLLEQNQLIVALEHNIQKKQRLCAQKDARLTETRARTAELEKEAAQTLMETMKVDQQIAAALAAIKDTSANLEEYRRNLEGKRRETATSEQSLARLNSLLQSAMLEIDPPDTSVDIRTSNLTLPLERQDSELDSIASIRRRVRHEMDEAIAAGKPPL